MASVPIIEQRKLFINIKFTFLYADTYMKDMYNYHILCN